MPRFDQITARSAGLAPRFDQIAILRWRIVVPYSTIDITWQGYGPTSTSTVIFRAKQRGVFFTLSHNHVTNQNAVTTGVVTDEAGNNLVAVPTLDALIANATGGFVVVVKS